MVVVRLVRKAMFAKVKVIARFAFVTNTDERFTFASIAAENRKKCYFYQDLNFTLISTEAALFNAG